MIVNIKGTQQINGEMDWAVPKIYFDQRSNYSVSVTHVHLVVDELKMVGSFRMRNNDLWCLCSNVIDQSSINPIRSIVHFAFDSKMSFVQNWKFDTPLLHPLNLYELENANFAVKEFYTESTVYLKNIFIQLKITKLTAYDRLQ